MTPESAYADMRARSRERSLLASVSAVLGWDEQTYMPKHGATLRGDQLGLLAGLEHERATDPRLGELLALVERTDVIADPTGPEAANVREWRRAFDRQTKLPRDLVEALARATSAAQQAWVEARAAKNFAGFRPHLETIVGLKRREAECLADGGDLYDALLDAFEPGARSTDLASLFDDLRRDLVPLVDAIAGSPHRPDATILDRDYPVDRQRMFGEAVAAAVGFDFGRGRLDAAAHPFCSGFGPGDCRITTRFNPRDLTQSFFGILHEVGHGLYEQGLDPAHAGTPMGEAVSLGVHESQSRLWENLVGRSRPFWAYWLPMARRVFRDALAEVDADAFYRAINAVKRSPIRVEADEVTYNLHIMVRFDLERALIAGDLTPADVPSAWNESYARDLGITPADDAEGCLQDIHWSAGLFGYFPTYTLGNVYAAQLHDAARRDLGDLDAAAARGDTGALLGWLRAKVHRQGQRLRAVDLVREATGSAPERGPLVAGLRSKYGEIYGL